MQTKRNIRETGNVLLYVLGAILVVSLIGAIVLRSSTTRFNVASNHVRAWKEALSAAEAGGDIAFAEIRRQIGRFRHRRPGGRVGSNPERRISARKQPSAAVTSRPDRSWKQAISMLPEIFNSDQIRPEITGIVFGAKERRPFRTLSEPGWTTRSSTTAASTSRRSVPRKCKTSRPGATATAFCARSISNTIISSLPTDQVVMARTSS